MRFINVVVTGWLISGSALCWAQDVAETCVSARYKAFDFWIGEWNVYTADGKLAGTNSIRKMTGGCVVHESYTTGRGYNGQSVNIYDATRQVWHQTWVDSTGALLILEGGLVDGNMVLEGQSTNPDQTSTPQRISWTLNPDGSVRQLWQSGGPNGVWSLVFDGLYRRKSPQNSETAIRK